MKKVILCTNIPAPYSVDFYNELGKYCDLTVLYERYTSAERDAAWVGDKAINFKEVYLKLTHFGVEQARGGALRKYIKHHKSDVLIFANYASPASLEAIIWCRLNKRKYVISWDGGFYKEEPLLKKLLKKIILCGAEKHLISCDELKKYLFSLGVPQYRIYKYPFTSIRENDIVNIEDVTLEEKMRFRRELGIEEKNVVLSVGQMIPRKGIDILIKAAVGLNNSVGVYIVGGEPSKEMVELKEQLKLSNVHFVDFKVKEELKKYYSAADVFVFPTREDIWGLVVNEAMSRGLPVISSNRSIAAQEMIIDGENGFMVEPENEKSLHNAILTFLNDDSISANMFKNCLKISKEYTIEAMAKSQAEILAL